MLMCLLASTAPISSRAHCTDRLNTCWRHLHTSSMILPILFLLHIAYLVLREALPCGVVGCMTAVHLHEVCCIELEPQGQQLLVLHRVPACQQLLSTSVVAD